MWLGIGVNAVGRMICGRGGWGPGPLGTPPGPWSGRGSAVPSPAGTDAVAGTAAPNGARATGAAGRGAPPAA
eukprot:14766660-Alexandrium_andersonii.AAC.1